MKTIIRENTWIDRNHMNFGWGNGYVLIPQGNPLHGKGYDEINVDVNGGLTFAELVTPEMIGEWPGLTAEDEASWMVGFDTCHAFDNLNNWPKEAVQAETDSLKEQLEELSSSKAKG